MKTEGQNGNLSASGGSRAAQKRRKKKEKLKRRGPMPADRAEQLAAVSQAAHGAQKMEDGKQKVKKRKMEPALQSDSLSRRDNKSPRPVSSAAGQSTLGSASQKGTAKPGSPVRAKSSGLNASQGNGKAARGQGKGGKGGGESPSVVDAREADSEARAMLQVDAHELLADPDIDSGMKARQLLQWVLAPLTVEEFYREYWEKKPLVVRGRDPSYFDGWLHTADIEGFVSHQAMRYGIDLDVTNYVNDRRVTLNPKDEAGGGGTAQQGKGRRSTKAKGKGKANGGGGGGGSGGGGGGGASGQDGVNGGATGGAAAVQCEGEGGGDGRGAVVEAGFVWEKFAEGCSLRMPCPQKFSDPLHGLLGALEEEWGCMVGSNVYLTPPGNQGFAPHYDDIEAFLLQVEGVKKWRVYQPLTDADTLPRFSSPNFSQGDLAETPHLETELSAGDLLYLPRGWIHQARTHGQDPSLHITLSAMQMNSWADFLETLVPMALTSAIQQRVELRRGMPRDYLEYMGVAHEDEEDVRRERLASLVKCHLNTVISQAFASPGEGRGGGGLLDAAADQLGRRYISDRLPPALLPEEEAATVLGRPEGPITPFTRLRLVRRGAARLLLEDGLAVVYHCMDNARVHHINPLRPLQFELDDAPAIETLLGAYPTPVTVKDLPHPPVEDMEDKVEVAKALYREGFLVIVEDEGEDEEDASDDNGGDEEQEEEEEEEEEEEAEDANDDDDDKDEEEEEEEED